jgi:predicted transcriptional regulator
MRKAKKKTTDSAKYKIIPPSEPQARAAWDEMLARHAQHIRIFEELGQTLEEIRQKATTHPETIRMIDGLLRTIRQSVKEMRQQLSEPNG